MSLLQAEVVEVASELHLDRSISSHLGIADQVMLPRCH